MGMGRNTLQESFRLIIIYCWPSQKKKETIGKLLLLKKIYFSYSQWRRCRGGWVVQQRYRSKAIEERKILFLFSFNRQEVQCCIWTRHSYMYSMKQLYVDVTSSQENISLRRRRRRRMVGYLKLPWETLYGWERARGGKSRRGVASEVAKKKKKKQQLIYQSGQLPHSRAKKKKKKNFLRPVDGFFFLYYSFFRFKNIKKSHSNSSFSYKVPTNSPAAICEPGIPYSALPLILLPTHNNCWTPTPAHLLAS